MSFDLWDKNMGSYGDSPLKPELRQLAELGLIEKPRFQERNMIKITHTTNCIQSGLICEMNTLIAWIGNRSCPIIILIQQ